MVRATVGELELEDADDGGVMWWQCKGFAGRLHDPTGSCIGRRLLVLYLIDYMIPVPL
jgi:hypothetical protein